MVPEAIQKFIDGFSKLPAVGPRMATRLAFYLLNMDRQSIENLENSFKELGNLKRCEKCFFFKGPDNCVFCENKSRDPNIIAIVEKETDILSIEKTGSFKGGYLVLGKLPEKGVLESIHKLRLATLKTRIKKEFGGRIKEIIIALDPGSFGDFIAGEIKRDFKSLSKKITRLGRGIPTGGEIEFADEETLSSALERRD